MSRRSILITGQQVYAFHGCLKEESLIGGNYVVDVVIHVDFTQAAAKDALSETVDYVVVGEIVAREMSVRSKLIETVLERIVLAVGKEYPQIAEIEVTVRKMNPPVGQPVHEVAVRYSGPIIRA
jgi:dihydroneopterin aldolase